MSTATGPVPVPVPVGAGELVALLETVAGSLAGLDAAGMPAPALAGCVQGLVRADAALAAALGRLDALSGPPARGDLRTGPQRCHDALEEAMR